MTSCGYALWLFIAFIMFNRTNSSESGAIHFNPDGQLRQLEYAKLAVQRKGASCIGMKCKDGALIATFRRKPLSRLIVDAPRKVFLLEDDRILIAVSGLLFEAPLLLKEARKICQSHYDKFNVPISVGQLCNDLADIMHALTQSLEMRPLGLSLMICGVDDDGPISLYSIDPDGYPTKWKATAIGYNNDMVTEDLFSVVKTWSDEPSLEQAWPSFLQVIQNPKLLDDSSNREGIDNSSDGTDCSTLPMTASTSWDMEVFALSCDSSRGLPRPRWTRVPPSDY